MITKKLLVLVLVQVLGLWTVGAQAALTLSVELNPNPVRPGEVLTARLTVTNNGGSPVSGVSLQATMPASINSISIAVASPTATCIQGNTSSACDPGEQVNWVLGTIPAGGGVTVSVPLTVASAATDGTTITLNGNVLVSAVSTVTGSASATVATANALSLSVDADSDPVAPGATLTYTLTYGNRAASSSVTSLAMSFPVPAGTTFVSATGGGTLVAGSVQWSLGSLAATQSDQQQVVVTVDGGTPPATVLAVNPAILSGTSLVAESAQATAFTRVAAATPLLLGIEMNPDPVRPNEQLTVDITVTNRSGSALTGVVLQARMPLGVGSIGIAAATGGAACVQANTSASCDPTELMNWNLGTLPAGTGVTLSVPLLVASTTGAGRLVSLEALVNDDGANRAVAEDTAAVDSDSPLSLAVDEDGNPVAPGATLTYTIDYANRGASASVTGLTLDFPVPAGTTFVSATGGGTLAGGHVQWTLPSLPATQSAQQQVLVSVGGALPAGTQLAVNAAILRGSTLGAESARATARTRVTTATPLRLVMEINPDPVRPGELLTTQLTVTNRGASPMTGVVLDARLPLGVNAIAIQVTSGGATCVQLNTSASCDPTERASWALGTIPAGGGITLSLPLVVTSTTAAGRLLTIEALVTDDSTSRAVTTQTVAVDADEPLSLAVDEDKNPVAPGNLLTYTLAYGNRATTSSVTGTILRFPVPVGTTFVSATGGGTLAGGVVQWTLGSVPATQSDQQQVVVSVDGGTAAGTPLVVNAASLAGSGINSEAARASAVSRVAAAPPLSLAIEANPDPARPGELLITEVTVSNRGLAPLTGVVLQARVPQGVNSFAGAGMTLSGACVQINTSGACDFEELATWNLGTIPAGTGTTVSMPMVVTSTTDPGQLVTLEAVATDDGVNRAVLQQTVAVDGDNPLTLAVDEERDAVPVSGVVTYSLTYGNRAATGSVTGTTLSFPLPVEAVLLGSTGGSVVDGNVVWNLGSIAAGAGGRKKVTLSVPGVTPGAILRVDAAQMHGNVVAGVVPDAVRATGATRVEASQPLGLSAVWSPDPAAANAALTGTLTVQNNSGGTLTGVVLQARMPQGVNSINPAVLTGGGTCVQLNTSGNCDFTELANWNLGTMTSGATATVTMPLVVTAGTVNGRLITIESLVRDDSGRISTLQKSVLLNPFTDTDGDGVAQLYDNCTAVANADQRDTNYDGFGNLCDPDFNGDGIVNINDFNRLKARLGITPVVDVDTDLDGNGAVNINDLNRLKSYLGQPPGPSALAP